jgi:hypothetical protein
MKPVWWMVGSSVLSWLACAALPGLDSDREVLLGMLAPLLGAVATWTIVARTDPARPQLLTSLLMAAFGAKLLFFAVYVTVAIKVLLVSALPFVVSFTVYFIALHLYEALCLQRLFACRIAAER